MGLLADTKKLFHHVAIALRIAKHVARLVAHCNDIIQDSTAPGALKTASASLAAAAAAFLAQVQALKDTL